MNAIQRVYHDNDSGYTGYKLHSFFCQIIRAFRLISLALMYMVLVFARKGCISKGRILHIWEYQLGVFINNFGDLTLDASRKISLFSYLAFQPPWSFT